MELTVIIPTLNEAGHIEELVNSIERLDDVFKEIIIADGGSEDGTQEKVFQLSQSNPRLHLVNNPDRYVSQGFNRAFQTATGKYISLVGAHAIYPPNYFSTCMKAITNGECDVAGGFLIQRGKTDMGKAISYAMSSKFGVGDTAFRTQNKRMYVDSVAFAVYDRKIFNVVGLLDEELARNQDDEFHYRLNRAGFRILMLPELEVVYYVRDSLKKLISQYYQYGYYKPLVFKKVSTGVRLRHLIPSLFVLYLFSLPLALLWVWWLIPVLLYTCLAAFFSMRTYAPFYIRLRMLSVFPSLHIAYGLGFLIGLPALWRK